MNLCDGARSVAASTLLLGSWLCFPACSNAQGDKLDRGTALTLLRKAGIKGEITAEAHTQFDWEEAVWGSGPPLERSRLRAQAEFDYLNHSRGGRNLPPKAGADPPVHARWDRRLQGPTQRALQLRSRAFSECAAHLSGPDAKRPEHRVRRTDFGQSRRPQNNRGDARRRRRGRRVRFRIQPDGSLQASISAHAGCAREVPTACAGRLSAESAAQRSAAVILRTLARQRRRDRREERSRNRVLQEVRRWLADRPRSELTEALAERRAGLAAFVDLAARLMTLPITIPLTVVIFFMWKLGTARVHHFAGRPKCYAA